jgi:hypothetical protein
MLEDSASKNVRQHAPAFMEGIRHHSVPLDSELVGKARKKRNKKKKKR